MINANSSVGSGNILTNCTPILRRCALTIAVLCAITTSPFALASSAARRGPSPSTIVVTNCDDAGEGSLRDAFGWIADGGTIDLSQLTCGTITLELGTLVAGEQSVRLIGPGDQNLKITAAHSNRVLFHAGKGTLSAYGLTFADGTFEPTSSVAEGGCIRSDGTVHLEDVTVSGCFVRDAWDGSYTSACGGGVSAQLGLVLVRSRITGNVAQAGGASNNEAKGAGVCSYGTTVITQSVISDNALIGDSATYLYGGGLFAKYGAHIDSSTLSNNYARHGGGGAFRDGSILISDSTISGNRGGGVLANGELSIFNSTVAFNTQADSTQAAGVTASGTLVVLQSSILANNVSGISAFDLSTPNNATVGGAHNLIGTSTAPVPADTISEDAALAPLSDNGGLTPTHALPATSPAVDAGDNTAGLVSDQRGAGYLRVSGHHADIGAFEFQDVDFIFGNGFE